MIPVRLRLRNFMCYRDNVPPLDFTGIHLACLSGDNGNGKSAIIDAMTWALWGKTRAASDDDLIHSTQSEMEVEFDFSVGKQLYRILRKRSRPKKRGGAGQSDLQFQVNNENSFRAITGNTMTQTQQKIIETLHMDYDTFINSAYLRQGHADEFTRQIPSKRKEVLGNIIGLTLYDELEDKAKEFAKQYEADSARLEASLKEIAEELTRKPAYEVELEQAQSALARIEAVAKEKETILNGLRQKKEALESRKTQLDELETHITGGTRDLQRWEEQAAQHQSRIKKYEDVISKKTLVEASYLQFLQSKKLNDELYEKSRKSALLEKQKSAYESRIEKSRNELTSEHTVLQREIGRLETKAKTLLDLKNQLGQITVMLHKTDEAEAVLRQKDLYAREAQARVNYLEAENTRLDREIGEAADKLNLISSHIASHTEAKCPLCESELTQEGLELIAAKYTKEKQDKTQARALNMADLARKKEELEALLKEKLQLEASLNQEKAGIKSREELIKAKIKEIEEDNQKLAENRNALNAIESRLAAGDFSVPEQHALASIETEIAALGYDAAKHEQARQELRRLEPYERDKHNLDEALKLIDQEKTAAVRAQEAAQALQETLKLEKEKKETLSTELVRLPAVRQELAAAETDYRDSGLQRSRAQEALGNVKANLERLTVLESKKKEKEGQLTASAKEESVYRELSKAFGKAGIQALLIEIALPEIENEANKLLSRMTDNRMTVKFETQKETKKGTVQETLDIAIADELGTRNYEMFSGGEAFRINFAVRIALSRMLARRAGAPLPTLIIDEGFGTQDNTGIEKLKEAITSIQDDFEKILVITHLEELKDAFPTRIEVTKTPGGSMISVN